MPARAPSRGHRRRRDSTHRGDGRRLGDVPRGRGAQHPPSRHEQAARRRRSLAIRTLGFRGEALAAIASVSRLVLRTSLQGAPRGNRGPRRRG
jgi:hypothetical protein